MEPFTNEQQAVLEKAFIKFLEQNKELNLRRIIGNKDMDYQTEKVTRGFASLEAAPPVLDPMPNVGQIALACALGYQDLRFKGVWRESYPKLVAWLDRFAAQVPVFAATKVEA